MIFEWDESKRESNFLKHGLDFLDAVKIFDHPILEWPDSRQDYEEERLMSLGVFKEDYFVIVSTWRGEKRRIISAWKAGTDEKRAYHHHLA
ncbi:MAG: BrnT family toxin [Nitrospirales bacterium]|nr:BrnT family toxin [Nitrospirales bacterium]